MADVLEQTLAELIRALQARELSPVDVAKAVLQKIEGVDQDLNAVVALRDPEAILADARESQERLARGDARPFEGIPFGVKDLEDVAGMVTSHGSVPFKDNVAARDSVQVERLKRAGAIVVGKTNTSEFGATAITKNLLFGVTRNPWDPECSPGGSSGGSAAALAASILPLATAADGGGSIRIPACLVGAFGFKPSYGRIPIGPREHWYFNDLECYGPISKTVEDAALFLDQVVGGSEHDPSSLPHPGYAYGDALREPTPAPLRIGYSPDLGYAVVQDEVAQAVEKGARTLEGLGHRLEALCEDPPQLGVAWVKLGVHTLAAELSHLLPEHEAEFGRSLIEAVKRGTELPAETLAAIMRERASLTEWCARTFERYDLLVMPTIPFDAMPARGPYPAEIDGRPANAMGIGSFTIPFNFSGHPAASVRVGLSSRGMPMGMQIVGPRLRDDLVLQIAHAFERERPWRHDWPS